MVIDFFTLHIPTMHIFKGGKEILASYNTKPLLMNTQNIIIGHHNVGLKQQKDHKI